MNLVFFKFRNVNMCLYYNIIVYILLIIYIIIVYIYEYILLYSINNGLPWCLRGKESACKAGDPGSIPGLGRSPGEGNGNPLQYSCLKNPMDRGAWWAMVHRLTKELEVI